MYVRVLYMLMLQSHCGRMTTCSRACRALLHWCFFVVFLPISWIPAPTLTFDLSCEQPNISYLNMNGRNFFISLFQSCCNVLLVYDDETGGGLEAGTFACACMHVCVHSIIMLPCPTHQRPTLLRGNL